MVETQFLVAPDGSCLWLRATIPGTWLRKSRSHETWSATGDTEHAPVIIWVGHAHIGWLDEEVRKVGGQKPHDLVSRADPRPKLRIQPTRSLKHADFALSLRSAVANRKLKMAQAFPKAVRLLQVHITFNSFVKFRRARRPDERSPLQDHDDDLSQQHPVHRAQDRIPAALVTM